MSMMEKHVQETKNKKEQECLTALASWFLERRRKRLSSAKNKKSGKRRYESKITKVVTTLRRETMAIALERTEWDVEKAKEILERFIAEEEEGKEDEKAMREKKKRKKEEHSSSFSESSSDSSSSSSSSSRSSSSSSSSSSSGGGSSSSSSYSGKKRKRKKDKKKKRKEKKKEKKKKKKKEKKKRREEKRKRDEGIFDDYEEGAGAFTFENDEERRKQELETERQNLKDQQRKALLNKMKVSGDLQSYKEQKMLKEELMYAMNIGDVAKAEKLRKKIEEAGDKGGAMDNYGFRPS